MSGQDQRTSFTTDCYTGVVLNKEPSAHVADQKVEATEENMEILLDENVSTEKDVKVLGIQVGDIIAMDPRTVVTPSGYIKSRFLDDKLSAAILLGIAKEVAEKTITLNRKVSLLFTVYEESFAQMDTMRSVQPRSSPTQPISTQIISSVSAGMELPPCPTSS